MLRVKVDVNGREIGDVGIWNTGDRRVRDGEEEIKYKVYDLEQVEMLAEVWHVRSHGAGELIRIAMGEVQDEPFTEEI